MAQGQDGRDLFRAEAVEARRRASMPGASELLPLPRWVRWSFRVLVVAVGAAIWAGSTVRIPDYVTGAAVVLGSDPDCVVSARLPARARASIESGASASFRPTEGPSESVEVALDPTSTPGEVEHGARGKSSIAVSGTLRSCPGPDAGRTGTLEVVAGTRSALSLVPGLGPRQGAGS